MIIFLYGKDSYRLLQRKKWHQQQFAKKHNASGIADFDFEEDGATERLRGFLSNRSLFETSRFAVVRNPFLVDFADLAKGLLDDSTTTLLVVAEKKPPKKQDFLLKKPVVSEEFPELSKKEIKQFIIEEAKSRDVEISGGVVSHLENVYGKNTWSIATELEKMSHLMADEVEVEDLSSMGTEASPAFFGLLQQLKKGPQTSVAALSRLFGSGEDAAKLFYILSAQWGIKAKDFAYHDKAIKSGNWEYEEALLALALS